MTTVLLDASVIVPSHRGATRLPGLLSSLAAQDHEGAWEAVVVLDGVLDTSPEILAEWRERLRLRVVTLKSQGGVVTALNEGYAAAQGRVLIRCDDDLLPRAHMVRRHVELHTGRDDLGVVGPTRDQFDDGTGDAYARAYGRPTNERALAAAYARPPKERWISWAAHNSLTRATWDAHGGFDPTFAYSEDTELGVRLHEAGIEIVVDRDLELPHTAPATTVSTRAARAWVSGAARAALRDRHPGAFDPSEPSGAWGRLVTGLAHGLRTRQGCARAGAALDRAIASMPTPAAGRAIAALVEAAARAGEARGSQDLAGSQWTYGPGVRGGAVSGGDAGA